MTLSMSITIRQAKPSEWNKVQDIYRREGLKEDVRLVEKEAEKEFKEIGTNRTIFFAEKDNLVIGVVQLVLTNGDPERADGRTRGLMHHMRIDKNYQNLGVGSQLFKTLLEEARARSLREITLEVGKDNQKARSIYEHWGFVFLKEDKNSKEIVMIKKLT